MRFAHAVAWTTTSIDVHQRRYFRNAPRKQASAARRSVLSRIVQRASLGDNGNASAPARKRSCRLNGLRRLPTSASHRTLAPDPYSARPAVCNA
jgi:hypothetical protein